MTSSTATTEPTGFLSAHSALRHPASHVRLWIVAIVAIALDLWSKRAAFERLPSEEAVAVIPRLLEFRRSLNDGAVFGSFTGYVGVFMIASVCAVAFVLYLFAQCHRRQYVLHVALALILAGALGNLYDRAFVKADVVKVLTGPMEGRSFIGINLSDPDDDIIRLGDWPDAGNAKTFHAADVAVTRQGVVRDFIKFVPVFPDWVPKVAGRDVWPWIFNVADAALVIGVIVLIIHSFFEHRPHEPAAVAQ